MEKLMNEDNEWDHRISAGVKEGPVCLQCFLPSCSDAVGWVAERASGLQKTEWWDSGMVFTRDSIYAIARICYGNSVCLSVCPSVCHTGGSVKNS